jgi:hypothetical protein
VFFLELIRRVHRIEDRELAVSHHQGAAKARRISMRNAILAALFGVGTVLVAVGGESPDRSGYRPGTGQNLAVGGGLISILAASDEQGQQLLLIDPNTRALGVYHIARGSGAVTLKSVRNCTWDLRMVQFNGASPLPQEIRAMLDDR